MEGHTPRGFAGSGTGLFVGDNLNPNFPNGDGVQIFLDFDLSEVSNTLIISATLRSNALNTTITGTPFEDLGKLIVEAVSYEIFSPEIWNTKSFGEICTLTQKEGGEYACDVSSFIKNAIDSEKAKAQLRLRFERASDSDGETDLLSFYNTNSNTNEAGLFQLEIISGNVNVQNIKIPITVHLVKESGKVSTQRDIEEVETLIAKSQEIWNQAKITFDVSIKETILAKGLIDSVAEGNFRDLYTIPQLDNSRFNIFYVRGLLGPNGIAISPSIALVADITTVDDFRATAHEIGHLLGLEHTLESRLRLLYPGANGRNLSEDEISNARVNASIFESGDVVN